jgi:outer membrane protein TolC
VDGSAAGIVLCAGCAAWNPMGNTPPSASRPWAPPDLPRDSADLVQREHANEPSTEVSVDPEKTYDLPELIDIAQRTNPETRVAWKRARQAAIAVGLTEGRYYPLLAAAAVGGATHLALPFPPNVCWASTFLAATSPSQPIGFLKSQVFPGLGDAAGWSPLGREWSHHWSHHAYLGHGDVG